MNISNKLLYVELIKYALLVYRRSLIKNYHLNVNKQALKARRRRFFNKFDLVIEPERAWNVEKV